MLSPKILGRYLELAEDEASLVTRALDGRRKALEGRSLFVVFMLAVRGVGRDAFVARRGALP